METVIQALTLAGHFKEPPVEVRALKIIFIHSLIYCYYLSAL